MKVGKYEFDIDYDDYNYDPDEMAAMAEALRIAADHAHTVKENEEVIINTLRATINKLESDYGVTFTIDGDGLDHLPIDVTPDFEEC